MAIIPHTESFTGRTRGGGEKELPAGMLGAQFYLPDNESRARLQGYLDAEQLLDVDKHAELYRKEYPQNKPPEKWVPVDFAGMLSRLMRQYTFGQEFDVTATVSGTDSEVRRITKHNSLFLRFRQATETLPGLGDAVFKVEVEDIGVSGEERPQAIIRYIRPHHYFPKLDPLDSERVEEVTLAWVFTLSGAEGANPESMAVLREVHTVGQIDYHVNRWDGTDLGDELPVSSHFPDLEGHSTGLDAIAVVHVGYQTRAGSHFGTSEFGRLRRLILALENRLSQEDEVLDKHARPKLIVGPGVLDEQAKANLADFDVIEVEPDILEKAVKPEYLTWDMQVGAIQHEIEKLEEYLFITSETSPASFGLERDGSQVESARALRFKAHRTINKVEDVRAEWQPAIETIYKLAQELENTALEEDSKSSYEVSPVLVDFGSAIVEDQDAEVQNAVMLKTAKLISRKRAVRDLYNLTEAEADAEGQEILQDEVDEAAVAATPATPAPSEFRAPGEQGAVAAAAAAAPGAEPAAVETPPADLTGEPGLGIAEDIQKTLLNGAQVTALVAVVTQVATGVLPRDSGLQIIQTAFGLDAAKAEEIMGQAGLQPPPDAVADEAREEAPEDVEPAASV